MRQATARTTGSVSSHTATEGKVGVVWRVVWHGLPMWVVGCLLWDTSPCLLCRRHVPTHIHIPFPQTAVPMRRAPFDDASWKVG